MTGLGQSFAIMNFENAKHVLLRAFAFQLSSAKLAPYKPQHVFAVGELVKGAGSDMLRAGVPV